MRRIKHWRRTIVREIKRRWRSADEFPDPLTDIGEAIERLQHGESVAVWCPVESCVMFNGFSLAPDGYHPFVSASAEMLDRPDQKYSTSRLESYYATWQPADALEALIGAPGAPTILRQYPAYLMPEPWSDTGFDERRVFVEQTMCWESAGIGGQLLGPEDGHGLQGPVTPRKGAAEFDRLKRALSSIARKGYDRRYGELTTQVLKRGPELRQRIVHGHHRAGILAAMGHKGIVFQPSRLIELENIAIWPQVRNGMWSTAQAEEYFHHHFDFDSGAWARERGLI